MDWTVSTAFKNVKEMEPKSVMDMAIIPTVDGIDVGVGSSEKGNIANVAKPRKKSMTSVYLKFFETAPDGKTRRCKFCGQSYSIATATGNLGRHLANRHPGYDKSGEAVTTSAPQAANVAKKPQAHAKPASVDFDHLNWLLIKLVILASFPPSTLEEKWLANSYKFLNPSIELWPRDKFQAVFHEVFRSMREDIQASLDQVTPKVSITLDFWTSYEQITYMSIMCHWIDDNWSLQKVLLDISRIPYPYGGAEIYSTLVKVLKMYNIENRVLSCTHDNSQNAMHACHTLTEDLDGQKAGPFCYFPCAARALNLIIEDGLRTIKPVVSKIRDFVLEMNASLDLSDYFIQSAAAYQEGSWKIPLDVSSRWNGNYLMLDIVRKASKSIDAVIRKFEEKLGHRMLLSSQEKNLVNIMHAFLEPFYKTTNNICTSKMPTIGLVLFFMDHISETITACRDSRHSPDWLKNAAEEMAKRARSYNNQVSNIFTYMTAILDPRIKVELIPESLNSGNYLEEARTHFLRNYATTHFHSLAGAYSAHEIEEGGPVSFAEEIARKRRRASTNNVASDELTQYLGEPPAPIATDVLEWWKVNSTRYPRLSLMARDFLAVQATSVAPEELFCSKGDEIDKQRYSMPYESAQYLLCVKSWTQSGRTLKYKSTEIDFDRLMELAASAGMANGTIATTEKRQK